MVEGRISAGVVVGDGSRRRRRRVDHGHAVRRRHDRDLDRRALPAGRQLGPRDLARGRVRRRGRPLRDRRHPRHDAGRRGRQGHGAVRVRRPAVPPQQRRAARWRSCPHAGRGAASTRRCTPTTQASRAAASRQRRAWGRARRARSPPGRSEELAGRDEQAWCSSRRRRTPRSRQRRRLREDTRGRTSASPPASRRPTASGQAAGRHAWRGTGREPRRRAPRRTRRRWLPAAPTPAGRRRRWAGSASAPRSAKDRPPRTRTGIPASRSAWTGCCRPATFSSGHLQRACRRVTGEVQLAVGLVAGEDEVVLPGQVRCPRVEVAAGDGRGRVVRVVEPEDREPGQQLGAIASRSGRNPRRRVSGSPPPGAGRTLRRAPRPDSRASVTTTGGSRRRPGARGRR